MSEDNFTEDIRVRVPRAVKQAFDRLGALKCKKESELAREAFMLYLEHEAVATQLNDSPTELPAPARVKPGHSVNYGKGGGKKKTFSSVAAENASSLKPSPSGGKSAR